MERKIIISGLVRCLQLVESDSDSSDTNEENVLINVLKIKSELNRIPRIRSKNYVESVVPLYTNKAFQMHFR